VICVTHKNRDVAFKARSKSGSFEHSAKHCCHRWPGRSPFAKGGGSLRITGNGGLPEMIRI
jgi:hypothetical protein